MIKKIFLFTCLSYFLIGCCPHKAGKVDPELLFVMVSKFGEIKKTPDGSFQLILDHGAVEKVLGFSNRPLRVVRHMTGEEFKREWTTKGPNSFSNDPPSVRNSAF